MADAGTTSSGCAPPPPSCVAARAAPPPTSATASTPAPISRPLRPPRDGWAPPGWSSGTGVIEPLGVAGTPAAPAAVPGVPAPAAAGPASPDVLAVPGVGSEFGPDGSVIGWSPPGGAPQRRRGR